MPDSTATDPITDLCADLVSRASVTPADAGCQELIAGRLERLGFSCTHLRFGEVDNLLARCGRGSPAVAFVGHTDVVPTGDVGAWSSPPFTPSLRDGLMYGRGTADMKGAIAALVVALEKLLGEEPPAGGSIAVILTSDEEGPGVDGVRRVMEYLHERDELFDYAVVIEPSSSAQIGDVVRVGRRGSLNGRLTVRGRQGHVAYPDRARNPIHEATRAIAELTARRWDEGNEFFPPSSLQFTNFNAGTGADNVIPGALSAWFNFRFSTECTPEYLEQEVCAVLTRHGLDYELEWQLSGRPFMTREGALTRAVADEIAAVTGRRPELSTGGGTSDGRWIAPYGIDVVEVGPVNESIHKVDEHIRIADLAPLSEIYLGIARRLLAGT